MNNELKLSKIINDPVHGFIEVPRGILLILIDQPAFQRLRRIKQLGLTSMVFPGAMHTRFNHALGAMHLTRMALDVLRRKDVRISDDEYEATLMAILLHDIGHGPFSHSLEYTIIQGMHHEEMSLALIKYLDRKLGGRLKMAEQIFEGKYHRKFFHQLVSSQLDLDRMDYLIRDSFFTGVVEGIVGLDRIIKTLNVLDDRIVVESKGIYSVEKFILARRLMYWQVYHHKASLAADFTLVNIMRRAREVFESGVQLELPTGLDFFFHHPITPDNLNDEVLERFIALDDSDIEFAIKRWQHAEDRVLSDLCDRLLNRRLLKVKIRKNSFGKEKVEKVAKQFCKETGFSAEESKYFVFTGQVTNQAYTEGSKEPVLIHYKNGKTLDLATASDMENIMALARPVVKYYFCRP